MSGGRQYICSCLAGAKLGFRISISLRPCCSAGWTAPSFQTDSFPPCTKTRAGVSRLEFSQAWVVRVLVSIQMDQATRCQGSGVAMPVTTKRGRPASGHRITSARISPPVLRLGVPVVGSEVVGVKRLGAWHRVGIRQMVWGRWRRIQPSFCKSMLCVEGPPLPTPHPQAVPSLVPHVLALTTRCHRGWFTSMLVAGGWC